jgi:hypothetical protein
VIYFSDAFHAGSRESFQLSGIFALRAAHPQAAIEPAGG